MTSQTSTPPLNLPRRKDRAKDDAWIAAFLQRVPFGTLATESQGQPFQKPTLFIYLPSDHAIYFHGANEGRLPQNLAANPRASFCAAEMGRLLPADTAMEFGVEYASVVAFGPVRLLSDPVKAERALQLLLDRYFPHMKPGEDYQPILPEELNITAVYRLDIQAWSGKEDVSPSDFPGAFEFPYSGYSPG
jgi:nitroimidazol reductase NimA-like FMN-containing flavoprotein (pyridoxamine 5'-phosphate oxidase superfamily)